MRRDEDKLWDYVRKNVRGRNTHLTRVESHATAVGVPDLNFCLDSQDGWIELKAKNTKGLVLRKSQRAWMRDRLSAGATNVFILWSAQVEYMDERGKTTVYGLVHCTQEIVAELARATDVATWHARSMSHWHNNIDFDQLRKELTDVR